MTLRYELRVLKGLHEDARCTIDNGASVGSDHACDIVLSDEGIAAHAGQIYLQTEGWIFTLEDGLTNLPNTTIAWNRAITIGNAWITVAAENDPWVFTPVDNKATDSAASPHSARMSEPLSQDTGYTLSQPSMDRLKQPKSWATLILSVAIGFVILCVIILTLVSSGSSSSDSEKTLSSADQSLGKISAALDRLGVSSSLHATISKTGVVTVSGWARDREQYEAVASAMSQIWPMPAMQVSLESEAIMTARTVLQRFSVKYDPLYQGNGRMDIVGVASSARERASALDSVRAQLLGLSIFGNKIELTQEVGDRFSKKLSDLGIHGVTLTWYPGHLSVQPPELDDPQTDLLEKTVAEFNAQYWNIAQLGAEPNPTTADSVPFEIRSVIGGPQPFIVLADGNKLLIGGTYKRYQLVSIEDSRIIFDGPRRAIVTR